MCKHYAEPLPEDHRHHVSCEQYDNCVLCFAETNGPMTQEQVGKFLGVTKEWISQIERRALKKLRQRMAKIDTDDLIPGALPVYGRRSQIAFDRKYDFSGYLDCCPLRIND